MLIVGSGFVGCVEVGAEGRRESGKGNPPPPTTSTSTHCPII